MTLVTHPTVEKKVKVEVQYYLDFCAVRSVVTIKKPGRDTDEPVTKLRVHHQQLFA